jgi:hypothetical protein
VRALAAARPRTGNQFPAELIYSRLGKVEYLLRALRLCGRKAFCIFSLAVLCVSSFAGQKKKDPAADALSYLGFDANDYPGDTALPALKQTFAFAGYWLNPPPGEEPGESVNSWAGKRETMVQNGFGLLVLFNGRWERELKNPEHAASLGTSDAKAAAEAALREGFARGTIIFVDQEEGGNMEPDQLAYLLAWFDGVAAAHFGAGVYCSGMPAKPGGDDPGIAAEDIRTHAAYRHISYFVYNDACPPAPGCVYGKTPPAPAESGVKFAVAWQYAQSPRRRQFTKSCGATYQADGNCYPAGMPAGAGPILLDLDSATSADPSHTRP